MGRQLFLHHYLPAHLASTLVTGALVEFVFNTEPIIEDEAVLAKKDELKRKLPENSRRAFQSASERLKGHNMLATWAASGIILSVVIWGWWFFLPLTYGKPALTVEQVNARKWLGYDLHFAK
jgi:dolichyl-phosphate-mannose-protein mannosyltransferase